MAVLGRTLFSSAERLDLSDLLSIESYVATDFRYIVQALAGFDKPYVLRGFDVINPSDSIGGQSISVRVADSVVFFPMATAGSFYTGLPEGSPESQPLTPDLKKGTLLAPVTNYVYLTFSTVDTAQDTRAFWDPDKESGAGGEFTNDVNTESVLQVVVNVSTSAFPSDGIPVCKVVVGATSIQSIQDCRDMFFRLGTGGASPDPLRSFEFRGLPADPYKRAEPLGTINSSTGANPFQGADKNIYNLKEWMDVVMTKLRELGGTSFWYEDASAYNIINMFKDTAAVAVRSKGQWELSSTVPGQLTWTETVYVKNIADPRDVMIVGPGTKTLSDGQVMYIVLQRGAAINALTAPVYWTQNQNFINGDQLYFANLKKGDWIKPTGYPDYMHCRVEEFFLGLNGTGGTASPNTAKSIIISSVFLGTSANYLSVYSRGVYQPTDVLIANRTDAALTNAGGNLFWLAARTDTVQVVASIVPTNVQGTVSGNGTQAKFVSVTPHGLTDGGEIQIAGSANYDGIYAVQVESATVFYFDSIQTATEVGVEGNYAVATTAARSTAYSLQLESANHNFADESNIIIAGTSSAYNGTWRIKVRSATTFSFPIPSAIPSVIVGTITAVGVNARTEVGPGWIVAGEGRNIGAIDSPAMFDFLGMTSSDQAHPDYNVPSNYGTPYGAADYNSLPSDNVTARLSKLTSMMAARSQDRQTLLSGENIDTIANATSGLNQLISFVGGGPKLRVNMSECPGGFVGLSGTLTLAANQAAYFTVDRNSSFSFLNLASLAVGSIASIPITDNTLIFALRGSGPSVYLWDGSLFGIGIYPYVQNLSTSVRTRLGVIGEDLYEDFFSTSNIANSDTIPAAISKLDAAVAAISADAALEEAHIVGVGGTTIFTATTLQWDPSNTVWDILVFVNGLKQTQDVTGGILEDYAKTSSTVLTFSDVVPENARITVRVEKPLAYPAPIPFFRFDSVGFGGVAAFTSYNYDTGTDRLQAFRNGIGLVHSTLLGDPVDRYTEATANTVTLGSACPNTETLSFINLSATPDYRSFITGETTTAVTIPTYSGASQLMVLRNGLLMNKSALGDPEDSYSETTPTSITLASTATAGEVFTFLHLATAPVSRAESATLTGATINVGFSYTNGTKKLLVFRNGVLLNSSSLGGLVDQYSEPGALNSSQNTVVLQQAATLGEVFTFILLG